MQGFLLSVPRVTGCCSASTAYLEISPIGSVRSGYPVEGAAALGFRARILRSSSGMK